MDDTQGHLGVIISELSLTKAKFKEFCNKPAELMHYCMLLDTLGDHEGMLNCALLHIELTCVGGQSQSAKAENMQRDMFAVACKKYITAKLEMARVLRDKRAHIRTNSLGVRAKYIEKYTDDFDKDLLTHIQHITAIIDQQLIPCCVIEENKVFYYKMLADYFRHTTDFFGENSKEGYVDAISESLANYRYAMELGQRHLDPTSPIFLSLVLNYSAFMYDMQNNVAEATLLAETAFDRAVKTMHVLPEDQHKESTLLLQLLRDNLQLWKHAAAVDEDGVGEEGGGGLSQQDPEIEPEA